MRTFILVIVVVVLLGLRLAMKRGRQSSSKTKASQARRKHTLAPWQQKLWTVAVFTKLSTRRFFRDRLAIFFVILFPLIFLFVFGGLNSGNSGNVSFKVALI